MSTEAIQFHIHPGDEAPIYRQIMRQVKDAIATGRLKPGDRVASHRELAEQLVISPLTVKKAYDEMERDGYIETLRGRGTFVSSQPPSPDPERSGQRLRSLSRRLLTEARLAGLSDEDLARIIAEVREELNEERARSNKPARGDEEVE